jgi:elongation factor Ts
MSKVEAIKKLREVTGLGLLECKAALEACNWNPDKALDYAKEHVRPSSKPVGAGAVFSYVHHNQQIGVLLELHCGTDFVARSEDFQKLGNALTMHVAAMDPRDVDGLLAQDYLKDNSITVGDFIKAVSARFNEPIKVARFHRYILGVSTSH